MKVCAVIVTYGDRFHLLKQVIESCFREGVNKVIVVDNASVKNSRKQLKKFEEENKEKLKVIYLDENTGSAGGYKRGLQEAYKCINCDYVLLLDDDNVMDENFLVKLEKKYIYFQNENNTDLFVIQSYRNFPYINDFIKGKDYVLNKHMYRGFDFINVLKKHIMKQDKNKLISKNKIEIPVAPYGGMFFNKKILESIGFPNEKLYLYADDFEFSYRIAKKYKIYLVPELIVYDIDLSWSDNDKKTTLLYHPFVIDGEEFKTYYLFRNSDFFERKVLFKKGFYFQFNRVLYIFILIIIAILNLRFRRIKTILKSIYDAKGLK